MSLRYLLPPSQTKTDGGRARSLDLTRLAFPELTEIRTRIVDALVGLAAEREACAATLGLSARQSAESDRNAALRSSPTMAALDRYAGVLYDAIGLVDLDQAIRRRAGRSVLICSALLGAVRASDPIPAYRLSAGDRLPGMGGLASIWRAPLTAALAEGRDIVDLRSGAYVALAPLEEAIVVRVVRRDGRSVSHDNKAVKGRLVRAALHAARSPRTSHDLIRASEEAGLLLRQVGERELELVAD